MQRGYEAHDGAAFMFATPQQQLEKVIRWNRERGWGFTEEEIAAAREGLPRTPRRGRLVADVLEVTLRCADGVPGPVRTFRELIAVAFSPFAGGVCWDGYERLCPRTLRLAGGAAYRGGGLRWERLDLASGRGIAPATLPSDAPRPGLCVLAACALHPRWVESMDGHRVPYVWLPGIDLSLSSDRPWGAKPRLGFSQPTREVRLHAIESWRSHQCWAVPRYV